MTKYSILLLTLISAFIIVSCNDDDDPSSPSYPDIYNVSTANSWEYDYYDLDLKNNRVDDSHLSEDVKAEDSVIYVNRKTIPYATTTDASDDTTREYYYSENGKLYATTNFVLPADLSQFPIPIPEDLIPKMYVVIANQGRSEWEILKIPFEDIPITIFGQEVLLNGNIIVNGIKGPKETITVNGKEYKNCQKFTLEFGLIAESDFQDMEIVIPKHIWFAEGIGMVKLQMESLDLSMFSFQINGYERLLK